MHEKLGELIRQARVQRGWEQSELAQRLGSVGQQTVSRWERGQSRPRPAVIAQLAGLLNLSESQLLSAAGHKHIEAADLVDSPPPVRTRLATLPFQLLSAEEFENFSADLARHLFPGAEAVRNGGSGSRQDGADVIVRTRSGALIAIQCKQVKEFGPARVREVVSGMRLGAARYYLYLSRTASPEARKEIAKHPGWQVKDAKDLSADVRYLNDQDAAVRLVETYFGVAYREVFLGLPDPGPWLPSADFFRHEASGRIYSHDWTLVGRATDVRNLTAFLDDPECAVAVIVGRGGIGKSRLLRDFARTAEQQSAAVQVRFLARNAVIGPRDFESLPTGDQIVIVIDDAHDRSGLSGVITGIRRARPGAKIVLSLRPQGRGQLRADLRAVGLHQSDVHEWCLDDLELTAAEALAAEALGPHASPALPQQLAALAPDCPLLIVVGGALIDRGRLDPARLAFGAAFREEIMTAFRDAVALADPAAGPDIRQEILNAIAALQPFRIDQPPFRSALSGLAGRPFDQLMPHIRHLEEAAVLIRRGNSLRIVPDLLGDAVFADAALDLPSGASTEYLERVLAYAEGDCLLHIFANASRVDWQIRTGYLTNPSLVESLWPIVTSRFRNGDIMTRLRLLDVLRRVAFFQPAATIELVRWAMTNPATTTEAPATPGRQEPEHSKRLVLQALPGVLENAAYNCEHLRQAADLLWELAERDVRPPNQHPGHPIRILQGLIEYNLAKSTDFHDLIIDAAAGWLHKAHTGDWLYSPFEVLRPLLATAVMAVIPDGMAVKIRTYAVTAAAVKGLRGRVLDLTFAEARSRDPRRAVEAMRAIGESIRYENPADPHEQQQWTPLFIETIERIGDLFTGPELDPTVTVAAKQALWWHVQYSQTGTRRAANNAWNRLPNSASHNLALALHDGWGHLLPHGSDAAETERLRETALKEAVAEATQRWPDERLVEQIEERLTIDRRAFPGRQGSPRPFIWTLAHAQPSAAQIICQRVAQNPNSILQELLPAALNPLAAVLPGEAIRQALSLLATREPGVTRYVAEAFGFARGNRSNLLDGEDDLLRSLLGSDEPDVRCLAVTAVIALARTSPGLALELLTSVNFTDSPSVAEAVAAAFGPYSVLSWADLPENQADQILRQIHECPSIDSHEITSLLAEIAKTQPDRILSLLKGRVETWENKESSHAGYLPLPRSWHVQPDFKAHNHYPALLRSARDWVTQGAASPGRRAMGAQIFAAVAGRFDEQARAILMEALESDDTSQVEAAGAILREAPPELPWDLDFVSQALHAAARHGAEHAEAVGSNLLAAAINGSPPVTLGQSANEQAGQHDRLIKILDRTSDGSIAERFYRSLARWNQNLMHLDDQIAVHRSDRREW